MLFLLAFILILVALYLFWQASRLRRTTGLPSGRVIYTDTRLWGKVERPLFDPISCLTGRPDYLVEQQGFSIPVEVKSTFAPSEPYPSHVYQLAAYCLLVERTTGKRPPYGILHYRNRSFALDYTPELEANLQEALQDIRLQDRLGAADRSHVEPARCARCGYRTVCDQRL